MEGLLYCTINIFCLAILITILGRIMSSSDKRVSQVTYSWFIISSIILCASDLLWGIVDYSYNWQFSDSFDFSVNSIYHVFTIVVSYLWFLYAESEQESRTISTKTGWSISVIPLLIDIGLILSSYKFDSVFRVNSAGEYERGRLYILHIFICFSYILFTSIKAFVRSFRKDNYMRKDKLRSISSFCIFPLITAVLQVLFVGSPMISAGVTFASLQVYVSSRERLISVDPLTKLNNRMEMVRFLDTKMKNRSPGKDLYLFIMDLDYFKKINDKYGHIEGDIAITIVADALKSVVRKTNFFVCRYGGDEFVIIGEVKSDFDPGEFREEINRALEEAREKNGKDYILHMSIGYFKYTPEIRSVAEFVSEADKYLYKQKSDRLLKRSSKEQDETSLANSEAKPEKKNIKKFEKKSVKTENEKQEQKII